MLPLHFGLVYRIDGAPNQVWADYRARLFVEQKKRQGIPAAVDVLPMGLSKFVYTNEPNEDATPNRALAYYQIAQRRLAPLAKACEILSKQLLSDINVGPIVALLESHHDQRLRRIGAQASIKLVALMENAIPIPYNEQAPG